METTLLTDTALCN